MTRNHEQIRRVGHAIDALKNEEGFVSALVADGWSEMMAREGFRRHCETWNVLEAAKQIPSDRVPKSSALHIWPALPGAGVSPWIYSALCGVPNLFVKASRRGRSFAEFFERAVSPFIPTQVLKPEDDWRSVAQINIVSGSDETIDEVTKQCDGDVLGYGHRVSITVADGEAFGDVTLSKRIAEDVFMWRQMGCFSTRSLVLIEGNAEQVALEISEAFESVSQVLQPLFTDQERAQQVKQFATSDFIRPVFGTSNAWVEIHEGPTTGQQVAPCVLTIHPTTEEHIFEKISIPDSNRQGVALQTERLTPDAFLSRGFTRVCTPGLLQTPPISWLHDGMSNVDHYFEGS